MNAYNMLALEIVKRLEGYQEYLDSRCTRSHGAPVRPDEALQFGYAHNAAVAYIFKDYAAYYTKSLTEAQTAGDLDAVAVICDRELRRVISNTISNEGKPYYIAQLEAHYKLRSCICAEDGWDDGPPKSFNERALNMLRHKASVYVQKSLNNTAEPDEFSQLRNEYGRLGGDIVELTKRFERELAAEIDRRAKAARNQKARERRAERAKETS